MGKILRKRGAITSNFQRKQEFIAQVRDYLDLARYEFPEFTLTDENLPIVFYKRGQAAGYAKHGRVNGVIVHHNLEFSIEAIGLDWDHMINDVVPHEIAHVVDAFIHGKSSGHGKRWQRIAIKLGCSASTTHSMPVTKARLTTKYLYIGSLGNEHWLTKRMHNQIQRKQQTRVFSKSGEVITPDSCEWVTQKV